MSWNSTLGPVMYVNKNAIYWGNTPTRSPIRPKSTNKFTQGGF